MEEKVVTELEELSYELARNFGLGLRCGIVVGGAFGIVGTIAGAKVTELMIRRWELKKARAEAKTQKNS